MSSTPTLVSVNASGLSLCSLRTYLWPSLLQPYPAHMLRVALCPASLPHPSQPAPPSCLGCPSAAAPRTLEQQGTLVRGHLSQSADEEAEAQGGKAPCPRLHSELVSEPAQAQPPLPQPFTQTPFPPPQPFLPALRRLTLPASPLCPAPPRAALTRSLPVPLQGALHQHPCAGPKAPCAYGMRPWQVGSDGNSAHDSLWGEALSHSVPEIRPDSDSDSAGQVPWAHSTPMAKVRDKGPCPQ